MYETRVLKDESDPMFQEQFVFSSVQKFEEKTLTFRVWHFDRIAVEHPPIGELAIGKFFSVLHSPLVSSALTSAIPSFWSVHYINYPPSIESFFSKS